MAAVEIDGTDVHVEGDGAETIVMVHGWPDTYRLWDAQVAFLRDRYRCVRFTLPGFDIAQPRRAFSVDEIAEFLRRVVERVSPGARSRCCCMTGAARSATSSMHATPSSSRASSASTSAT